jgi:hypothetical protein
VRCVVRDGVFVDVLTPGKYLRWDFFNRERIDVVSQRAPQLIHDQLDLIAVHPMIANKIILLELNDSERGLVWIDGRFHGVLLPGRYAYFTQHRMVRTEVVDARPVKFVHPEREAILNHGSGTAAIEVQDVAAEHAAILTYDGKYVETLGAGRHTFWKNRANVKLNRVDLREQLIEVPGQEVLTADRVTLRITAIGSYVVTEPQRTVTVSSDVAQALYREVQLAIRTAVGIRTLDVLLAEKESLAENLLTTVTPAAKALGVKLINLGVRDIILPGEMKDLLNKVIEARTAAEASVITRREETAALRHQSNAAKLLAENPMLLRMKELETVEKVAASGKLNIVLGEKGLTERVINLL